MRNLFDDDKERSQRIKIFTENRKNIIKSITETEEELYTEQRTKFDNAEADTEHFEEMFHLKM